MKKHVVAYCIVGFLLAGHHPLCIAQRLCIKTNLPAWGFGFANMETEWINTHPNSFNLGYHLSFARSSKPFLSHHTLLSACWLDYRYWFSGRVTIGTAVGLGGLYMQTSPKTDPTHLLLNHAWGVSGSLIHCFTLHPRWTLEAKLGLALVRNFRSKETRLEMRQSGLSLMYIIQ